MQKDHKKTILNEILDKSIGRDAWKPGKSKTKSLQGQNAHPYRKSRKKRKSIPKKTRKSKKFTFLIWDFLIILILVMKKYQKI